MGDGVGFPESQHTTSMTMPPLTLALVIVSGDRSLIPLWHDLGSRLKLMA